VKEYREMQEEADKKAGDEGEKRREVLSEGNERSDQDSGSSNLVTECSTPDISGFRKTHSTNVQSEFPVRQSTTEIKNSHLWINWICWVNDDK
jgi:hypothetical protein